MKNKTNISLATEIIKSEIAALSRTLKRIDHSFDKACELINKNLGKIITIGLGKSGYIAMKLSLIRSLASISEELIIPAKDIAIAILKIFEPIIFPTIKSTLPFLAD